MHPSDTLAHLAYAAALVLSAGLFALIEIQIEGRDGWASKLPTWRYESAWTRWLLGSRAVTGYHVYVHLFVLLLLHLPFALALTPPTAAAELRILSFWILLWILEDFLWFALNPAFGLRRFNPVNVWWHRASWWGFMPRDYWIFTPLGLLLYVLSWTVGLGTP